MGLVCNAYLVHPILCGNSDEISAFMYCIILSLSRRCPHSRGCAFLFCISFSEDIYCILTGFFFVSNAENRNFSLCAKGVHWLFWTDTLRLLHILLPLRKYELTPLKSKDVYEYKTDMNQLRNKLVSVSSNHVFGSDVILSQK